MRWLGALVLIAALTLAGGARGREGLLLITATAGYRHDSIPAAVAAVEQLAAPLGLAVRRVDGPAPLATLDLAGVRLVVLAQSTGDFLAPAAREALQAFVEAGGGLVGIHAAADAHHAWAGWGRLLGTWFRSHPPGLQRTIVRFAPELPGLASLGGGRSWEVTDEIYDFRDNPRGRVQVIATVDESTYEGGRMGADHPIAWCFPLGAGRSWYTGLGHRAELYADPIFREHLRRGLAWAAGRGAHC